MEIGDIVRVKRSPEYITIGVAGKVGKIIDIVNDSARKQYRVLFEPGKDLHFYEDEITPVRQSTEIKVEVLDEDDGEIEGYLS